MSFFLDFFRPYTHFSQLESFITVFKSSFSLADSLVFHMSVMIAFQIDVLLSLFPHINGAFCGDEWWFKSDWKRPSHPAVEIGAWFLLEVEKERQSSVTPTTSY